MPITLQCPSCGSVLSVPTSVAGRLVQCPSCGAQTKAPPQSISAAVSTRAAAAPGVASAASRTQAPAPASYECANCGGMFGEEQVFDDGGAIICRTCYESLHPGVDPTAPPAEPDPSTAGLPVVQLTCAYCRGHFDPAEMEEQDGRPVCHNCINTGRGKIGVLDRRQHEQDKFDSKLPIYVGVGIAVALLLAGVLLYMNSTPAPTVPANVEAQPATAPSAPVVALPTTSNPSAAPAPSGPVITLDQAAKMRADWEAAHSAEVLQMIKDADKLAEDRDLETAYKKYANITHIAAGHVDSHSELYKPLSAIPGKQRKLIDLANQYGITFDIGNGSTTVDTTQP